MNTTKKDETKIVRNAKRGTVFLQPDLLEAYNLLFDDIPGKSPYVFDSDVEEPEDYEPTLGNVYVEYDSMI